MHSLYPSVEIVDGKLWGVMTAGLKAPLSGEETAELKDFVVGQNADGIGAKDLSSAPSKHRTEKSTSASGTMTNIFLSTSRS